MHRKASGEIVMYFPFFFLLTIVGVGIWLGVYSFYGGEYDYRLIESTALAEVVSSCFTYEDFFASDFDLFGTCGLEKSVVEKDHLILLRRDDGTEFFVGVYDYVNQCELAEKNDLYPRCYRSIITKNGVPYDLVVGSNQGNRRLAG